MRGGGKERRRARGPRCSPYQDLFASLLGGRRGGRVGYGGAYLRVIPEGRTPSAWDPTDNVPPFRATPLPYTGCRSRRIDCALLRYVEIKMKTGEKEEGIGEEAKQRRISASDFLFPRSLTLLFLPLSILFDISQRKYENPSGKNAETMTWKGERGLSCGCERYCRALGNACRFQRR